MMSLDALLKLLKSVLLSPEVIIITIVIALYINIVNYVVRYRKKTFQPKKHHRPKASAAKAEETEPVIEDE